MSSKPPSNVKTHRDGKVGRLLYRARYDVHGTSDSPGAVALAPGGKIAVAGARARTTSITSTTEISAARLNSDGTIDRNFGDAGTVVANLGALGAGAFGLRVDTTVADKFNRIFASRADYAVGAGTWRGSGPGWFSAGDVVLNKSNVIRWRTAWRAIEDGGRSSSAFGYDDDWHADS